VINQIRLHLVLGKEGSLEIAMLGDVALAQV